MEFENGNSKVLTYADSSKIFFSDDLKPSAFYPDAYQKYGQDVNLKFLSADTISISGIDTVGKYWETRKKRNVVYGYAQVPSAKNKYF